MKKYSVIYLVFGFLCAVILPGWTGAFDLGEGKFVLFCFVNKDPGDKGTLVISDSNTEKKYLLPVSRLKNFPDLKATLLKAEKDTVQVRLNGVWSNKNMLDPANLSAKLIRNEKECPYKTLSTHTITGIYLGTEWGDMGHVTVTSSPP